MPSPVQVLKKIVKPILRPPYRAVRHLIWSYITQKNIRLLETLQVLDYKAGIEETGYLASDLLIFEHFYRIGRKQIIIGDRRLKFAYKGLCDYHEKLYLAANPDVVELIRAKKFQTGLDHFLAVGYREIVNDLRVPYLDRDDSIRRVQGNAIPVGEHLVVYAHYDKQDKVDPYVVHAIRAFREHGFDVVFATGTISDESIKQLKDDCLEIIIRGREGYDFSSWIAALKADAVPLAGYDRVVFANDSVYFPVCNPTSFFEAMMSSQEDLWGICDSYQSWFGAHRHVQSYFLSFSREARQKGLLEMIVRRGENWNVLTRRGYIEEFEYGITDMAKDLGLSVGVQFPLGKLFEGIPRSHKFPFEGTNPSIHLWEQLLKSKSCPVLKVVLARDNPVENFDWSTAKRLIWDEYPAHLIEDHLARMKQ